MVLCLTHSTDVYTIDIVQHSLEEKGVRSVRLNTDQFGTHYHIAYTAGPEQTGYRLITDEGEIPADSITAVWYRKIWELSVPPELEQSWHQVYRREYRNGLHIFLNALQDIPWINNLEASKAAGNDKLWQLHMAAQAGLDIPRTVMTNDAIVVQRFYDSCNGEVIMKLHSPLSVSMQGNTPFFPTTRLPACDPEALKALKYCPMIFQENIPKAYELRVIYIDGVLFAGQIPTDGEPALDWRTVAGGPLPWRPYILPEHISRSVTALMQKMKLHFGAIDIIRHVNGQYVFLEVNPQGEWGMLQKYLDYPIGETIAEKLIAFSKHEKKDNTDRYAFGR